MSELVSIIQKVLGETGLVLGWSATGAGGVAAPERFHTVEEAETAIFDSTSVHNLAVHLPRLKGRAVGIVAKACDARSIVELIVEREVDRELVKIIAVSCPEMLDVKSIWRRYGYGASIEDEGRELHVNGERVDRTAFVQAKCLGCEQRQPAIYDEVVGGAQEPENVSTASGSKDSAGAVEPVSAASQPVNARQQLREAFQTMSVEDRREFWREQYARCIRCHACREACPMCFCRDVCIMQTSDPHWTGGGINAAEAEMMQLIRVNHLAGRCTACGECERACPVGIPLMLLMEEQNRAVEEMFDYRAGIDPEAKPPLLTFDIKGDGWDEE
ncbi:MAG: 4Fe-4S dicluster domain-containing protein [Thermoleophilia bacterium]